MVESDSGPNWVTVRHSEKTLKIRKIVQGETVRPSSQQTKEKKKGRGQPVVIMLYEVEDGEEMPIQAGVVAITSRAADSAAMTKAAMIAFSPPQLFFFSTTSLAPDSSKEVYQYGCSFVSAAHGGTECWHGMLFPTLPVTTDIVAD